MSTTIQKEYAAVEGDEIVKKADTKEELERSLKLDGKSIKDYEVVALPKSHSTLFV